jgi:RsiW-degrading membrane proteinase PrsW (M82 family)
MTLFLASVVLGIVPMVVYALVVWRLDRWEKEPFPLLVAAFCWGAVPSILFALLAQLVFGSSAPEGGEVSLLGELYDASFLAPLTEELVKAFGVFLIFRIFHREVDSVLDGLIYGSMVGFGFSAVENVFYFAGQADAGSLILLFFLRAFIFGMLHALFTGLFGVGLPWVNSLRIRSARSSGRPSGWARRWRPMRSIIFSPSSVASTSSTPSSA